MTIRTKRSDGVATGGEVLGREAECGDVLYAALEDNSRRLKERLQRIAPRETLWPEQLGLPTEWPRLDKGGLKAFEAWIERSPQPRLIIVDTLSTVLPPSSGGNSQYQSDCQDLQGLHGPASDTGTSILVSHHVRKMDADDPFDTVSGTTGLTGAADSTLVLTSTKDGQILLGRGRDMREFERALQFDPDTCLWSDLGPPEGVFVNETRRLIRIALQAGEETRKAIAAHTGLDYDPCAKTLQRTAGNGEVQKEGRATYLLRTDPATLALSKLSKCPLAGWRFRHPSVSATKRPLWGRSGHLTKVRI